MGDRSSEHCFNFIPSAQSIQTSVEMRWRNIGLSTSFILPRVGDNIMEYIRLKNRIVKYFSSSGCLNRPNLSSTGKDVRSLFFIISKLQLNLVSWTSTVQILQGEQSCFLLKKNFLSSHTLTFTCSQNDEKFSCSWTTRAGWSVFVENNLQLFEGYLWSMKSFSCVKIIKALDESFLRKEFRSLGISVWQE